MPPGLARAEAARPQVPPSGSDPRLFVFFSGGEIPSTLPPASATRFPLARSGSGEGTQRTPSAAGGAPAGPLPSRIPAPRKGGETLLRGSGESRNRGIMWAGAAQRRRGRRAGCRGEPVRAGRGREPHSGGRGSAGRRRCFLWAANPCAQPLSLVSEAPRSDCSCSARSLAPSGLMIFLQEQLPAKEIPRGGWWHELLESIFLSVLMLEAALGRGTSPPAVPGAQPHAPDPWCSSPAGTERDWERGDEAAAAMCPLGLRRLLAASRPSLEQPGASAVSRHCLTQDLCLG